MSREYYAWGVCGDQDVAILIPESEIKENPGLIYFVEEFETSFNETYQHTQSDDDRPF